MGLSTVENDDALDWLDKLDGVRADVVREVLAKVGGPVCRSPGWCGLAAAVGRLVVWKDVVVQ